VGGERGGGGGGGAGKRHEAGGQGPAVRRRRAGFGTAVDGDFGKDTLKQLKAFQAAQGLPVTSAMVAAVAKPSAM
jgi:peptidoglycan hydrolase-like protein with peptidoglycan-binding domain